MYRLITTAALAVFATGCASVSGGGATEADPTTVHFNNLHGKDVAVAVTCGDGEPEFLGTVPERRNADFEIPGEVTHCVWGLRFWLIPEGHPRGYMTETVDVRQGGHVLFHIEKYPAQSVWSAR